MAQRYFEGQDHASLYAKFRPSPSPAVINTVLEYLSEKVKGPLDHAIDVGCGSGQNTILLAPHFAKVTGTDVSPAQIEFAEKTNPLPNVHYLVSPAEEMPLQSQSVQLVTACTACHWFDLPKFFTEVDRVLVPSGVVALYSYFLETLVDPDPDKVARFRAALEKIFYEHTAGCWGAGVVLIANKYEDIQIPYKDTVRKTALYPTRTVTLAEFKGAITAWSGIQTYIQKNGEEKLALILQEFQETMQNILGTRAPPEEINFDITSECFILMGRKPE